MKIIVLDKEVYKDELNLGVGTFIWDSVGKRLLMLDFDYKLYGESLPKHEVIGEYELQRTYND